MESEGGEKSQAQSPAEEIQSRYSAAEARYGDAVERLKKADIHLTTEADKALEDFVQATEDTSRLELNLRWVARLARTMTPQQVADIWADINEIEIGGEEAVLRQNKQLEQRVEARSRENAELRGLRDSLRADAIDLQGANPESSMEVGIGNTESPLPASAVDNSK